MRRKNLTLSKKKAAPRKTFRFGSKIRMVRERKGLTLKDVASRAGVSESLVSQIERNRVSPAIDTLLSLATVLDINLEFLFEEFKTGQSVKIIRNGERRTIAEDEVRYEELAKPLESNGSYSMESYLITIPPHAHTHRGSYGHLGRELGFIIQGTAEFRYENKKYILEQGDSISFSASSPHVLANNSSVELQALWVVSPPQRF